MEIGGRTMLRQDHPDRQAVASWRLQPARTAVHSRAAEMKCCIPKRMLNMRYLLPVLVILSSGLSAAAQTPPALFDGSFYGRSDLPIKQSTGNSAGLVQALSGVFEPIHELRANDPLRLLSTPIGRLDLLGEQADGQQIVETCTATLLPGDYLLTNSHCVPGSPGLTLKSAS